MRACFRLCSRHILTCEIKAGRGGGGPNFPDFALKGNRPGIAKYSHRGPREQTLKYFYSGFPRARLLLAATSDSADRVGILFFRSACFLFFFVNRWREATLSPPHCDDRRANFGALAPSHLRSSRVPIS